jgi:hypothetical protein
MQGVPIDGLGGLLGRLYRDEARLFRVRSGRVVQGSTQLATTLGDNLDRVLHRRRLEPMEPVVRDPPRRPPPAKPREPE